VGLASTRPTAAVADAVSVLPGLWETNDCGPNSQHTPVRASRVAGATAAAAAAATAAAGGTDGRDAAVGGLLPRQALRLVHNIETLQERIDPAHQGQTYKLKPRREFIRHRVRPEDTLTGLCLKYNVEAHVLKKINGYTKVGQPVTHSDAATASSMRFGRRLHPRCGWRVLTSCMRSYFHHHHHYHPHTLDVRLRTTFGRRSSYSSHPWSGLRLTPCRLQGCVVPPVGCGLAGVGGESAWGCLCWCGQSKSSTIDAAAPALFACVGSGLIGESRQVEPAGGWAPVVERAQRVQLCGVRARVLTLGERTATFALATEEVHVAHSLIIILPSLVSFVRWGFSFD
jgi:hypothetical protein